MVVITIMASKYNNNNSRLIHLPLIQDQDLFLIANFSRKSNHRDRNLLYKQKMFKLLKELILKTKVRQEIVLTSKLLMLGKLNKNQDVNLVIKLVFKIVWRKIRLLKTRLINKTQAKF